MVVVYFNGSGIGQWQGGGGKKRHNNQIKTMAFNGGDGQWRLKVVVMNNGV